MATKKTSSLDFSIDSSPQGDEYLLMDHRLPEPESSDAGKPVVATGADTYGLGKRTVIHVCTATANSSANAMMLDIAKSEVMDGDCLLVTFASLLGVRLMFNGGVIGNPMYSILYQGSSFPDDGRCLNAGDTWMVRFSNNTFNLLFRDREHFEDAMLGDGAFYPHAVQDYDGNWYHAVILGNQVWLTENLRTTHYSDGTAIEYGGGNSSDSTPYYYHPRGNAANDEEYGLLYNFAAVMNGASVSETNPSGVQGIAPTGWHVPSSAEWNQLKNYMERQPKFRSDGKTSSYIAKALASVGLWGSSAVDYSIGKTPGKNNRSGFNSKPAGGMYLPTNNNVNYDGENTSFFSSTSIYVTGSQTIWSLHHSDATFGNFGRRLPFSHSVRCVCDMTPYQFREWYVRTYGTMQHHLVNTNVLYGYCYENIYGLMEVSLYGNETITELQRRNPAFLVGLLFSDDMPSGNNGYVVEQVDGQYNAHNLLIHGNSLAVGDIKAGDLCFFVYEAGDLQLVSNDRWKSDIAAKQDVLVGSGNGQNIKTVNGNSLPGSGNIELGKGTLTGLATSLTNSSANVTINEIGADLEHGAFLFIQFAVDMPALARLNVANTVISNSDIIWNNTTLPAGAIKSGDICLFYYAYANGTNMSFLQWNSRWACLKTINNGTLSGNGNISLAPPHTYYSTSMSTANATTAITCAANERAFHAIAVTAANTQLNVTLANNWDNVIFLTGVYNLKLNIMIGGNAAPVHFESNSFFDGTNVNLSKAGTLKIVLEAVDGNVIADVDLMESYVPSN